MWSIVLTAAVILLAGRALSAPFADSSLLTTEKLIAEGKFRQALENLQQVRPTVQSHLLASKAYDGLNDPAHAVEQAEAALKIEPRSEAAHLQLGQIFLAHNTPQAAAEIFSEALHIHPKSFLLRLGRGLAWKDLMRYDQAEADLQECLGRQPAAAIAFDALATVYLQTKRFEDLLALSNTFRRHNSNDYRGPYFAAAALDGARQDRSEIEALLTESIRLNANFAAAHALVGKRRLAAGETVEAITALERALQLRPDYAPAALHLAQAYKKAGRQDDAENAFRRVREIKKKEQTPPPSLRYHRGK